MYTIRRQLHITYMHNLKTAGRYDFFAKTTASKNTVLFIVIQE